MVSCKIELPKRIWPNKKAIHLAVVVQEAEVGSQALVVQTVHLFTTKHSATAA